MSNLYRPTLLEVEHQVQHAVAKQPLLTTRWRRAGELLHADALWWNGHTWRCDSQSHERTVYSVDFTECGCHDHHAAGVTIQGVAYCKHRLALLGYREIAGAQIMPRYCGALPYKADRSACRAAANAGLLLDKRTLLYWRRWEDHAPTKLCTVAFTARGPRPSTEADLYAFARWLGQAEAMPVRPPDFEAAPAEWQPALARHQWEQWQRTGSVV
jgi:hypothetical protein